MTNMLETNIANHLVNMSPVGVVMLDNAEKVQWVNQTMSEFLSMPASELQNISYLDLTTKYLDGFSEHPDLWKVSNIISRQDRWLISLDCPPAESMPANGKYFVDVTEIMRLKTECRNLKDQLENNSTADTLTGLLNKRTLLQALEPQVSRSRRYNNPLSVIIMQIDTYNAHLKNVTPVTDQALTAVSFYLRDQMRWVDLVGRTQDNEFTLILPETNESDALKLARKINSRIQHLSLPDTPDVTIAVQARFGVAAWGKGDDTSMLLKKAKSNLTSDIGTEESVA